MDYNALDNTKKAILIGQRIRERREELALTQEYLGSKLGLDKSTIQRYETGQVKKIKMPILQIMAKELGVHPNWLALKTDEKGSVDIVDEPLEPYNPTVHKIPILGYISAGLPLYAEEHIEGYTYTEHNGGAEYFALRVKGDSMSAAQINDGNTIIVRKQDTVENGEIAVVRVDQDDATVKRFRQDGDTVQLIPQSFNPLHETQFYNLKTTEIVIIGKVVECKIEF